MNTQVEHPGKMMGFSKLSRAEKLSWMECHHQGIDEDIFKKFWIQDTELQKTMEEFSENTLTNFPLPFGIAPNFLINDKNYTVPMVIEESSVVAAAAKAASFWMTRGGFKAEVLGTEKVGHLHFYFYGEKNDLIDYFNKYKVELSESVSFHLQNMKKRGGGFKGLRLCEENKELPNYYKLECLYDTVDAMGANVINTSLEELSQTFKNTLEKYLTKDLGKRFEGQLDIILAILSNYTPQCIVRAWVSHDVSKMEDIDGLSAQDFISRFVKATQIAQVDVSRAVTNNKGIMNGVDAVVLATGNDFRAIEASVHSFAANSGKYRGLSRAYIEGNIFTFEITLPLALGTVGGLTHLHPLASTSLKILGNPNAKRLMEIIASVGLAQNFSAIRSLVTTGIQRGHMKLHLLNILKQLEATDLEIDNAKIYFRDKVISYKAVREFLKRVTIH